MTHYDIKYQGSADEIDADAVRDVVEYLDSPTWDAVYDAIHNANPVQLKSIDLILRLRIGISGRPVFALFRSIAAPEVYQAWYDALPDA